MRRNIYTVNASNDMQKFLSERAKMNFPAKIQILAILGCFLLFGCVNHDKSQAVSLASKDWATTETIAAGELLYELHKLGRLPGDSKDDHGKVNSEDVPLSTSKEMYYPILRSFYVVKNGDPATYRYTVIRSSKGATWRLQRAWKTDAQGQTVMEWKVPNRYEANWVLVWGEFSGVSFAGSKTEQR